MSIRNLFKSRLREILYSFFIAERIHFLNNNYPGGIIANKEQLNGLVNAIDDFVHEYFEEKEGEDK